MKRALFALFLLGCAHIQKMEEDNAKCLEYCEKKHAGMVIATGEWPCECRCVVPDPIER